MTQSVKQPFGVFTDIDGEPLESGYVYIGTQSLDPVANPITVYWDEALTTPATQPLRTKGGYLSNSGTIANVYTSVSGYSIRINNSNGSTITSALDSTEVESISLQEAYNEGGAIVTNATNGAVAITRGSAADTDSVFGIKNGAGTTVFNARGDNKVGLGMSTTAPFGNLHLRQSSSGAVSADTNADELIIESGTHCGLSILSGATTNYKANIFFGDSANTGAGTIRYDNTADGFAFATAGVENVWIGNTGNVGMGESIPLAKLHVKNADSGTTSINNLADELVIENSTHCGITVLSGATTNYKASVFFGDSANNSAGKVSYDNTADGMAFATSGTDVVFIDSSGNFGIGENVPFAKLHVRSADSGTASVNNFADELVIENSADSGLTILSGATANNKANIFFGDSANSGAGQIRYDNTDDGFAFATGGVESVWIDSSGNFGVGEVIPLGKAHIKSADSGTVSVNASANELVLENSGDCGMTILGGTGNSSNIFLGDSGQPAGGQLGYNNSTDLLTLATAGTVRLNLSGTQSTPNTDNLHDLGALASRWKEIFAGNATINTSDSRLKTVIPTENALLNAIDNVNMTAFKWNDAIEAKGVDNARIHYGVLAQEVKTALENNGLVAGDYSFLCHDSWEETTTEEYVDGELVSVTRPAGDRYGVRYEELQALQIKCLERRITALESV